MGLVFAQLRFSLFVVRKDTCFSFSLSHKSWVRSFFPDVNLTLIIEAGRDVIFQSFLAIQSSIIFFSLCFYFNTVWLHSSICTPI